MTTKKFSEEKIQQIIRWLEEMRYGSVLITVHKSEITQVDRVEKHRFSVAKKSEAKS